jgi:hypothetical protein
MVGDHKITLFGKVMNTSSQTLASHLEFLGRILSSIWTDCPKSIFFAGLFPMRKFLVEAIYKNRASMACTGVFYVLRKSLYLTFV